jgi:hypothetical protein
MTKGELIKALQEHPSSNDTQVFYDGDTSVYVVEGLTIAKVYFDPNRKHWRQTKWFSEDGNGQEIIEMIEIF